MLAPMLRRFLPLLAAGMLLAPGAARAQDCRPDAGVSAGTLAAPQAPCRRTAPAPTPRKKDTDPPNVFRSGNTTIQFGGSVQMNATMRGR
jgi:hypothetical protein